MFPSDQARELLRILQGLDLRTIGVLVRFLREASLSRDPHAFIVGALEDKLEKEHGHVTVIVEKR